MLLQILQEGRLTDSFGRTVDFKNTILIMTSNLGVGLITEQSSLGFRPAASSREREKRLEVIRAELESHFRPEFLNRLDAVVSFEHLSREAVRKIFDLELAKVRRRLEARRIGVEIEPRAMELLIGAGTSDKTGARGIRRVIEERIEDNLSEMIILGRVKPGDTVQVDIEDDAIEIRTVERTASPGPPPKAAG
jgi:ATP-dependent Clp protease ATP-binding subunit ClpC